MGGGFLLPFFCGAGRLVLAMADYARDSWHRGNNSTAYEQPRRSQLLAPIYLPFPRRTLLGSTSALRSRPDTSVHARAELVMKINRRKRRNKFQIYSHFGKFAERAKKSSAALKVFYRRTSNQTISVRFISIT